MVSSVGAGAPTVMRPGCPGARGHKEGPPVGRCRPTGWAPYGCCPVTASVPGTLPVVLIAEELAPSVLEVLGTDVEIRHVDGADRAALLPPSPTRRR